MDFKNMDKWDQQFIDALMNSRELSFENSRELSFDNENDNLGKKRKSKAAA